MIDTSVAYSVNGYSGVAFRALGHPIESVDCDGFETANEDMVQVVMIGDDRVFTVDMEDLTPIEREEFCGQCGQIGCGHDS